MSKLFTANKLALNLDEQSMIKCITNHTRQYPFNFRYNDKYMEDSVNTKFLVFHFGNHLNCENHVDQLVPKLSAVCYAVASVLHVSNADTLKLIYFACFHSEMKHGIIFYCNPSNGKATFILQQKIVRFMAGVKPRNSCRRLFKR
jgi:hypothetical protein